MGLRRDVILFFLIAVSVFHCNIFGGNENQSQGARSTGMGDASVCLVDIWCAQNNQACLAFLKNAEAGLFVQNRFGLKELNTALLVLAFPRHSGTFGFCVSSFGYSLYEENKCGLSYAKKIGNHLSLSIQLDCLSTYIGEGYESRNAFAGETGLKAILLKSLSLGVHLYNPSRTILVRSSDERMATVFRMGLQYEPSPKILIAVETEKDNWYTGYFKAGFEYKPSLALSLRAGVTGNPSSFRAGAGIHLSNISIDISSSWHPVLGYSQGIGLSFRFRSSKPI
ncbi:MAG TPA: hypothetical protein VGO45_11430 [Bacteroidia bacterium]|jgi:hypothetical protein|nr:hypothetical protein [Bacteroidia bacterium]